MDEVLLREREDRIEIWTLNRPDQLNALSPQLMRAIKAAAEELAGVAEVDCLLIRAAGRAFCAGVDIKAMMAGDKLPLDYGGHMINAIAALPQPVIAAVHGVCFTGGLELALGADFIIAAEGARFADTHAKWGMHASYGMTQRLPRRVGETLAKDMMFTGRELNGREAVAVGLATRCVSDAELAAAALACAREVVGRSGAVTRWIKDQVSVGGAMPLDEALRYEVTHRPTSGDNMMRRLSDAGWGAQRAKAD
jgi:enoyl-CoA hydratase/carnithine racemase